jgi:FtsP/CotA-like multicopper oxidase with cupredoxin domain
LAEATTVHWHGLIVPAQLDGGPHQLIAPGATWRPVLPVRQPAATLFYHSHVHGETARQVYRGLAGVLIVADDAEAALDLPSEYGVDDIPHPRGIPPPGLLHVSCVQRRVRHHYARDRRPIVPRRAG